MRAAALIAAIVAAGAGFAGGWAAHRPPAPLRVVVEDRNHDGRPDRWVERDERGRITRVRDDRNQDGFEERVELYVDGKINRVDYDSDNDRSLDSTDQLGGDGRVLYRLTDRDWNTVPERWVQLNARGQVTGEWIDANQDAAPERVRSFDTAGRLTEEGVDSDGDGTYEVDRTFNTRWPPTAGPLRIERDDDADGIYERRESYTVEGMLRSVNDDPDGDGSREHIVLLRVDGSVRKEGFDRDGDGFFEEWRFPATPARVAHDDDSDYDLDRWDAPGAPEGWCAARCVTGAAAPPAPRGP